MKNEDEFLNPEMLHEFDGEINKVHGVNFFQNLEFSQKIQEENAAMSALRDAMSELFPNQSDTVEIGFFVHPGCDVTLADFLNDML